MKFLLAVVVVLALLAFAASAEVVQATDENFESIISKNDFVLMKFYAPWCGHCKKLAPEYEKASETLKEKAVLAELDATAETGMAGKYDIKGYPTIKVFRGGQLDGDYDGGRTADGITKWVLGNVGPAITMLTTQEELKKVQSENLVVIVAFMEDSHPQLKAFEATAKALRTMHFFARVSDPAQFGSEAPGSIVIFKDYDEKREVFSGADDELRKFITLATIRSFDELGPDNYKKYLEMKLPMVWLFANDDEAGTAAKNIVASVAPKFKGNLLFVWINAGKYGQMAQRMGLKGETFPSLAIDKEGVHYTYDESTAITEDGVLELVNSYIDGKLTPTLRSEPIPETPTEDGLTTVVGKTFDDLVKKGDKDVLIEFYAPWCGHCKKLAPVYAKLAKALKGNPKLLIAKIDATSNDYDQKMFPVQGFPTLFFLPSGAQSPINYSGDRSFEDMLKFVKEQATEPVTVSDA